MFIIYLESFNGNSDRNMEFILNLIEISFYLDNLFAPKEVFE
jgi:hypothetical protein